MSDLSYESHQVGPGRPASVRGQDVAVAPEAWPVTPDEVAELEGIGAACLEFHQALETLYLRSAAGKNLLRNKALLTPWVAEYLDRGKPAALVAHARDSRNRGALPPVLRPDLLLTDEGWVLTELDAVPGGIGLTAFLNRLYGGTRGGGTPPTAAGTTEGGRDPRAGGPSTLPTILGADDAMVKNFYAALAALRPATRNPLVALVVSDEAATYRPEMAWLAHQLQLLGKRVFCLRPDQITSPSIRYVPVTPLIAISESDTDSVSHLRPLWIAKLVAYSPSQSIPPDESCGDAKRQRNCRIGNCQGGSVRIRHSA